MEITKEYSATGAVLGNYWGGGSGGYRAKGITGTSKEDILIQANKMLKDGSLDSGMGYESLIGAILFIECKKSIDLSALGEGVFINTDDVETVFIGDLTPQQQEFLEYSYNF